MKVCFETFGCRLNRAEALQMEADYLADGWETVSSHSDADLIIVRGCSVTRRAERDCEKFIAHLEEKYPAKRILTVGCIKKSKKSAIEITPSTDSIPTRTARAYLKVQDGCNAACTFCIVPRFRGKSTAVSFDDVIKKAEKFIENGYHEIVVTGCNLSQYLSNGKRLSDLLAALARLSPSDCRIRLGSLEPSPIASEVIDVMAENENICKYLHIPVQSGSDKILTAMRRPYLHRDVDNLVAKAIKHLPNLGLGCDLMTGFPDETEADFLATKGMLARLPFTKAHVFPYSERPGTIAAGLPNVVPKEIRSSRAHELAAVADEARTRYIRRFKGREVEMLIEHEKVISGWTSEYVWCQLGNPRNDYSEILHAKYGEALKRKNIVKVYVNEVRGHILYGDVVE